jgi:hypothetical protein
MAESLMPEIEECLRRYLQAHPHATDSERGIYEWWLRDAGRSYPVTAVRAAIKHLVDTGEITKLTLPDGRCTYASSASLRPRNP